MHTDEETGRHMLIEGARQAAAQASAAAGRNATTVEALGARVARIEVMLGIAPLQVTPADVLEIVAADREPTPDEQLGADMTAQVINLIIGRVRERV